MTDTYNTPEQLRRMLNEQREANAELRESLRLALTREREARAECERLRMRLQDLGAPEKPASVRGFRTCDTAMQARIRAMHAEGKSGAAIARLTGLSHATVSLVCRNKYPLQKPRKSAGPTL